LARAADRAGISYPKLLQIIVRAALERQPYDMDVPMFPPSTVGQLVADGAK